GERVLPVLPEEVLVQAGADVVPGKHLVVGAVAGDVPVDGEAVPRHGLLPQPQVEVLAPLLEDAAPAPHVLDDGADTSVAAGCDAFAQRGLGVVPTQLHGAGAPQVVAQPPGPARPLGHTVLPEPPHRPGEPGHD